MHIHMCVYIYIYTHICIYNCLLTPGGCAPRGRRQEPAAEPPRDDHEPDDRRSQGSSQRTERVLRRLRCVKSLSCLPLLQLWHGPYPLWSLRPFPRHEIRWANLLNSKHIKKRRTRRQLHKWPKVCVLFQAGMLNCLHFSLLLWLYSCYYISLWSLVCHLSLHL